MDLARKHHYERMDVIKRSYIIIDALYILQSNTPKPTETPQPYVYRLLIFNYTNVR